MASSQTPLTEAVSDTLEQGVDDGRESIDNRERGCGHLDANACYVRTDVSALSADGGEIPRFVRLAEPIEYKEHTGHGAIIPGYKSFPGNSFLKHYNADGRQTTPAGDIDDHFDRLERHGFDGDHFGEITSCHATDILMSVGVSNYATPDDYIDEARERGLNLKIPASSRQSPPVIEPLRTRCFVIHPNGCGDGRPGIIGYAYLVRNVFTTGSQSTEDDPDVPSWAEDYDTTRDDFDIVDRGEPIPADGTVDDAQSTLQDTQPPEATEDSEPSDTPNTPDNHDTDTHDDDTAVPVEDLDYNLLKVKVSREDIEVGSSPSKSELADALRSNGIETATVRRND